MPGLATTDTWLLLLVRLVGTLGSTLIADLADLAGGFLVSFPDPAFIESGSGTFRAISCIC